MPSSRVSHEIQSIAHPAEDFPADRTVVWSPIFQAAWDRMNQELGGPPYKVEPPNVLMAGLDAFAWDANRDLPAGGWKVWSGQPTPEFLELANREAAQMTGEEEGPFTLPPLPPDIPLLAVLALLNRNPAFEAEFHPDPISLRFHTAAGESQTVRCFGTGNTSLSYYSKPVRILHYGADSKALSIAVRKDGGEADSGESVVLYQPPQRESFQAAWTKVQLWFREGLCGERGSEADPRLHSGDQLCIPYLDLEADSNLGPRLGGARYHQGFENPWEILGAWMRTKFKMNEKGVELRVIVELLGGSWSRPVPNVPRDLRFNRPFFVFLCRDGAEWPYFGAWIGDHAALMESFDPEEK